MWTLFWEFLCYLGVLVVGVIGLFRWRATLPLLFVGAMVGVAATAYGPIDNSLVRDGARFGIMFLAGALVHQYRAKVPVRRSLMLVAAAVIAVGSVLPDYSIVAALPVAYLMLCLGITVKTPKLRMPNDFSYGTYIYAFPLQQLPASSGAASLGVPIFAVLSLMVTLPVAALSWFGLERQAMKLRGVRQARTVQQIAVS